MAAVRRVASTIRQIEHQAERDRRRSPTGSRSARPADDVGGGVVTSGLTSFDDNGPGESTGAVDLTPGLWAVEVRARADHGSPGFYSLFVDSLAIPWQFGPLVDPATGPGFGDRVVSCRHTAIQETRTVPVRFYVSTTPGPDALILGGSINAWWLRPLSPEGL